jgi:hypothetical protein
VGAVRVASKGRGLNIRLKFPAYTSTKFATSNRFYETYRFKRRFLGRKM